MVTCNVCGKQLKNTQGLRGHKNFVHADKGDAAEQPVAQSSTQQLLSSNSDTRLTTEQRLSKLESKLTILESRTGVKEPGKLEKLWGITDKPLTEQVAQLTQQLGELTGQLTGCVSREAMDKTATELLAKLASLQSGTASAYSRLATTINDNRESCENGLSSIEGQFTATTNQVYELSKAVRAFQESAQSNRALINQLDTKLASLEPRLSQLENELASVNNLMRRQPTGELVSVRLTDGRDHNFKKYKSPEGLKRPHRVSIDPFLGDCWIELAEPED